MTGFTLPAGSSIDEDNGDLVIKDSGGTIVLRRNESADEWQFEGADLAGINSLTTGDIQNDAFPGDINYNDPLWRALHRGMWYHQNFESVDGYQLRTQNSGSVPNDRRGLKLRTGSTADSYAGYRSLATYTRDFSGNGDRFVARIPAWIQDNASELFVVIGDIADPIGSPERDHVGFHYNDGLLEASAGNYNAHTTEQITTSYSPDPWDTWLIDLKYSEEARLVVYEASSPGNLKQTYTLSTGLPDTGNPDIGPQAYLNNESSSPGSYQFIIHKSPCMEVRKE